MAIFMSVVLLIAVLVTTHVLLSADECMMTSNIEESRYRTRKYLKVDG